MCCTTKPRRRGQGPTIGGQPLQSGSLCGLTRELRPERSTPGGGVEGCSRGKGSEAQTAPGESPSPKLHAERSCFSFADTQPPSSGQVLPAEATLHGHSNGTGQHTWPDGASFQGQYRRGLKHGQGHFTWASGAAYDGEFSSGHLEGLGIMRWPDGSSYEGAWKDGCMHGVGQFIWADGRSYEGEYQNDLKHGRGTFRWPDGRKYDGHWEDGVQHGRGTFISARGRVKVLEFVAGQRGQGQSKTS